MYLNIMPHFILYVRLTSLFNEKRKIMIMTPLFLISNFNSIADVLMVGTLAIFPGQIRQGQSSSAEHRYEMQKGKGRLKE